jgi:hypothetical protein
MDQALIAVRSYGLPGHAVGCTAVCGEPATCGLSARAGRRPRALRHPDLARARLAPPSASLRLDDRHGGLPRPVAPPVRPRGPHGSQQSLALASRLTPSSEEARHDVRGAHCSIAYSPARGELPSALALSVSVRGRVAPVRVYDGPRHPRSIQIGRLLDGR